MDIIPICEHHKILNGVCPSCKRSIRNGLATPEHKTSASPLTLESVQKHVYSRLVEKLDLSRVSEPVTDETIRREIRLVVERVCDTDYPLLTRRDRAQIVKAVLALLPQD